VVAGDKSGFGKASVGTNVGNDAESICGKCGDVWHVIVAKVGDTIVKVQCKQCGAVHRHRPPARAKQPKAPRAPAAPRIPAAPGEKAARPPRASASPKAPPGPRVEVDPLRPVRKYRPIETFRVGDPIEHATFGRGVVEALPEGGKIEVWFAGERRVLVHGRTPPPESAALPARKPAGFDGGD
jgi:hypothetical protein